MRPSMSFQIEGIVKTLSTESTQVTFHFYVGFQVTLQKLGKLKTLTANFAAEFGVFIGNRT